MERVVVTNVQHDLCVVSHEGQTLSAHSTERQALSEAFAFAAHRIRGGHDAVIVLMQEKGRGQPSRRRQFVA